MLTRGAATEGDASEDAAYDVADELYCVACDKLFRSANAMANHERCARPAAELRSACCLPGVPRSRLLVACMLSLGDREPPFSVRVTGMHARHADSAGWDRVKSRCRVTSVQVVLEGVHCLHWQVEEAPGERRDAARRHGAGGGGAVA